MTDELAGRTVGERIQITRERRGMTRPVVAGLVGRSTEWLKAIESGKRQPPRLDMLMRLGEVLGVQDLAELTGEETIRIGLQRRGSHDAVPAIREAIEAVELTLPSGPPPNARFLEEQTERAWEVWHTSPTPRADTGALLPQIIRDGRRAVRMLEGSERRTAYRALAGAYALTEQVLAWVADAALVWLAADRCMDCAQQADDPETMAAAAWVLGNVWRATGREDDAWSLVQGASGLLEPYLADGTDNQRALWGATQLHASITAAKQGREGDALRSLDQAVAMTDRMPIGYAHPWTLFGRANATMTGVSVSVELRKSGTALDYANEGDIEDVPSLDRQTRLWLEIARGYHLRKDHVATLHVLQRATSISLESMRSHPIARGIAGELVVSGGRLVEREARVLARRLGLTV